MMGLVSRTTLKAFSVATVAIGFVVLTSVTHAQKSMTVEELEVYIQEKKDELGDSIKKRDASVEKQKELESMLAEQDARQAEIEQELRTLCEEREEAEPGSLVACLDEMNLASN